MMHNSGNTIYMGGFTYEMSNIGILEGETYMATYVVNTGPNKEVHCTVHTKDDCKIDEISKAHRVDTDTDYTVVYPNEYDGCYHCYKEKYRK